MVHSVPLNLRTSLAWSLKNIQEGHARQRCLNLVASLFRAFVITNLKRLVSLSLSLFLSLQVVRSKEQTARVPFAEDFSIRHSFANVHGTPYEARMHGPPSA